MGGADMARKLAQNVYLNGEFYAAGSTPSKDIADQIDNPKAWGDDKSTDTSGESSASGGGSQLPDTVDELQAEIDKRNADREGDALITVTGTGSNGNVTKKDLVAALKADDAAASA